MSEQPLTKRQQRAERREEKLTQQQKQTQQKKRSSFFMWGIGAVVLVVLVIAVTARDNTPQDGTDISYSSEVLSVQEHDIIKGNPEAPVTLIEYSDFQCPACRTYYPLVKQLHDEFPDDLRIVYRHYPLVQSHPHATRAAQAAEAAKIQGKFWEMHDVLFETQNSWSNERSVTQYFTDLAVQLGLQKEQFETDIESAAVKDKVQADRSSGNRVQVSGTPTFYLNGRQIDNPRTYQELRTRIEQEIVIATQLPNALEYTDGTQLTEPEDTDEELRDDTNNEPIPSPTTNEAVCKDVCGDGQCQEVVCLAVGCPCAETHESCPQDCSE